MIQRNPPFGFSLRYIPEADVVEIILNLGALSPIVLGIAPDSFFEFLDRAVGVTVPFVEKLKKMRESGDKKELKASLNAEELDKLIELRKKWEAEHDKRD